jgi:PIN domain nuclease of toxin-antitoxin system
MDLLVDSHVFLWSLEDTKKLGSNSLQILNNAENVFVSSISMWELELKHLKGKLSYSYVQLAEGVDDLGFEILEFRSQDLIEYANVDLSCNDTFDRLLLAIARSRNLDFMTADKQILDTKLEQTILGATE